jgi:predicted metal-dependent peptidase
MDPIVEAQAALKVAKISMMMQKDTSFFTTILFSLKQELLDTLPTAATDGRNLLINPTFFLDLTPNERIGLLAHEVLHVGLDHMHRRGARTRVAMTSSGPISLWNMAADYVNNLFLTDAGYSLPKGGLLDRQYAGMSTEQVYDLLNKKSDEQLQGLANQCGLGSMNGQDVSYPEDAAPGEAVPQDEVTTTILRAATQAKLMGQSPGSVPGEIELGLERTLNPPLPWHVILQNWLTDFAKDDYSFRRPNKRFMPDHYLPTTYSESLTNIAIAGDLSSSMSDEDINGFVTYISEIIQVMQPKKTTVVAFNTKIMSTHELTADSDPFQELKFKGRGGTAIAPVHQWAADNQPAVLIIFTDGEFTQTKPVDPNIPIIWLIHNDPTWKSEYGTVIHYNLH